MPTLTWKVRVAESAWGATSRTRPAAFTCGSSVSAISTRGSRGPVRIILGHVEHGVTPAIMRDLHDHLPGVYHLAGLGADCGDGAAAGAQGRVAQLILRDVQLRLRGIRPALWPVRSACCASSNFARGTQPSLRSSCCR